MTAPIEAPELARLLRDLEPIGMDGAGATTRLAWTREDALAGEWFAARAAELGRDTERDEAGNLWAVPPGTPPPWWGVGSHLDTVRAGGRYDGALGVAAAFAIAARAPVAVVSFADEEGARFNTPTFGSRALAGRLDVEDALGRTDAAGVTLREALAGAALDAGRLSRAPAALARLRGFLELHIDQTTELAAAGAPLGIVSGLVARMRVRACVTGRADHAGTTPRRERHDALSCAARLILAGEELAGEGLIFTAARIEVEPNAASTVPALATVWLDARGPREQSVLRWRSSLAARAAEIAAATATEVELRTDAFSPPTAFPTAVREALAAAAPGAPELPCWAGHDAGVLATRIPAGMVLVRNPSGVSHSPHEQVSLEDAALAAGTVLAAVERL